MGTVEIINNEIIIFSHIITYGNAANPDITKYIREEIELMWNEPDVSIQIGSVSCKVRFRISSACMPEIDPIEIISNTNPANNYFRIEEFALGNISFVDGIGCNTGYFKLENLYKGSTTAAHEYGHTIGLAHPENTDLRSKGVPGIMYPRGTIVEPEFQYNPAAAAGDSTNGGTMHPKYRKVLPGDILQLNLHKKHFQNGLALLGDFSSVWHPDHKSSNNQPNINS